MANGDAAAAAGLATFAATQDIRLGYDNDNIRGDELAQHLTAGTHPASAINSGVLADARIPTLDASKTVSGTFADARIPNLDGSKITTGNINVPGSVSSTVVNVKNTVGGNAIILTGSNGNSAFGGNMTVSGTINVTSALGVGGNIYDATTYNQTNTGRAVYVQSDGLFGIGSSSARFKKNIKDANIDLEAVRNIAVRTFQYRADFSKDENTHIGVIAEELIELGLTDFVYFNDEGKADGVAYEKLALALIPFAQAQAEKLDAIEARLTALEEN